MLCKTCYDICSGKAARAHQKIWCLANLGHLQQRLLSDNCLVQQHMAEYAAQSISRIRVLGRNLAQHPQSGRHRIGRNTCWGTSSEVKVWHVGSAKISVHPSMNHDGSSTPPLLMHMACMRYVYRNACPKDDPAKVNPSLQLLTISAR